MNEQDSVLLNDAALLDLITNSETKRNLRSVNKIRKKRHKNGADLKLKQFVNVIYDAVKQTKTTLFTCPVCRDVLDVPVTVDCGHTYCGNCLDKLNKKCRECAGDISSRNSTNVLIQDIVLKWRKLKEDDKEKHGKCIEINV